MVNALKFRDVSLSVPKMVVIKAEIHELLVRIANREDPDQTLASATVCTVCLCLFGRQLVFKILEHLSYL